MANVIKATDIFTPDGKASSLRPHPQSESLFAQRLAPVHERATSARIYHESIHIKTQEHLQFVDLTDSIAELIRKPEIAYGFVNIQTRHTTAAIIVNENELPLFARPFRDWAGGGI